MRRRYWHIYRAGATAPTLCTIARTRLGARRAWRRWASRHGGSASGSVRVQRGGKVRA